MDLRESITHQTNVSFTIANHLFSKASHQDKNIVLSPLSLQLVLSIIAAGSEGPTQQQLLEFLHSKSTDHLNSLASQLVSVVLSDATPAGGPLLSFVDGVWIEQTLSLQPSFKEIVSTDFKANLSSVDFQNKVCISNIFISSLELVYALFLFSVNKLIYLLEQFCIRVS